MFIADLGNLQGSCWIRACFSRNAGCWVQGEARMTRKFRNAKVFIESYELDVARRRSLEVDRGLTGGVGSRCVHEDARRRTCSPAAMHPRESVGRSVRGPSQVRTETLTKISSSRLIPNGFIPSFSLLARISWLFSMVEDAQEPDETLLFFS